MQGIRSSTNASFLQCKKDFQIGAEDTKDVLCVGQRVCWKMEGSNYAIQVDRERSIEELGEIEFDKSPRYRTLLNRFAFAI